jgi:hypothetical protein
VTSTINNRSKRSESWTQTLQYVVLYGDRIKFYSVEIDQGNMMTAVRFSCNKHSIEPKLSVHNL